MEKILEILLSMTRSAIKRGRKLPVKKRAKRLPRGARKKVETCPSHAVRVNALAPNGVSLSPLPTRDSTLPILLALTAAKESGAPVSALVETLPPRRTSSGSIKGIATTDSLMFVMSMHIDPKSCDAFLAFTGSKQVAVDSTDGLRVTLASGYIVHLRPLGNAPEFRCYVEGVTQARADALLADALRAIGARFNRAS